MPGLRDITTKSAFRVLTILYLFYCAFPAGCCLIPGRPAMPESFRYSDDLQIVTAILTLTAAFALMISFRVGVVVTYLSLALQSLRIMSPLLIYVAAIGPSVWAGATVKLANWQVRPCLYAANETNVVLSFPHAASIPGILVAINLVPIGVMAVLWWVTRYHQGPRGRTSTEPTSTPQP